MIACIFVEPHYPLDVIAAAAGQADPVKRVYRDGYLCVEGVSQEALDQALALIDPAGVAATQRARAAAARRWQVENGGCVWNGWPVATDRDSQAKINAAYVMAKDGHWPPGAGWKFADGTFRLLTGEQVQAMALAVATHVQTCFTIEAAKLADLTSDIDTGWPE